MANDSTTSGNMTPSTSTVDGKMTPEVDNIYRLDNFNLTRNELTLPTRDVLTITFDDFWNLYPRKIGKGHARLAWARAIKKAPAQIIIAALQEWLTYIQIENIESRFIPHPTTWLNGERWEDEIEHSHSNVSILKEVFNDL